jgi:hypothetical protein
VDLPGDGLTDILVRSLPEATRALRRDTAVTVVRHLQGQVPAKNDRVAYAEQAVQIMASALHPRQLTADEVCQCSQLSGAFMNSVTEIHGCFEHTRYGIHHSMQDGGRLMNCARRALPEVCRFAAGRLWIDAPEHRLPY